MKRLQYVSNPPVQTLTEQSSKDLASYLQGELDQIANFIGELSDKADTPNTIGYGSVVSGTTTSTSDNVVSIATTGTFGNYSVFLVTLAKPIISSSILQVQVEGASDGIPLISAASTYVSSTTFSILIIKSNNAATTAAACTFDFICYERES
jgi:hypothetical protein